MPRFPFYFSLSLAAHLGLGWLLHDLQKGAEAGVLEPSPIMIQLVAEEPVAAPVALPAPAPVPKPVVKPQSPARPITRSPAELVASSKPRVEPAKAVARAAPAQERRKPSAEPRPAAAPAPIPGAGEPRPVAAAPATRPAETEVFSREPSFLVPPRPPVYPAQARRRNQQGVVLVEVRLDAHGQQKEIRLLRSSGVESLDRSALDAVAAWRFRPETHNGQPVPSRVHIPIEFALSASR